MNIKYEDARAAGRIHYASNLIGIATTMEQMVLNAIELNERYLKDDVAQYWALGHIRAIVSSAKNTTGLYPLSLRQEVFVHTKALYQMAYRVEHRNAVMAYPPLTIAAQVLANITSNDWYGIGQNRPGYVTKDQILHDIDMGVPDPVTIIINDESFYVNWYSDAVDECLAVVARHEEAEATEAAATDEERQQRLSKLTEWLDEPSPDPKLTTMDDLIDNNPLGSRYGND